ncbi:MAG: hypothetical protein M1822_003040 [Bathelium mastoideum]|nr:MAG: hypothetical protein M1822_003040 [Bathelium mastoideum]
MGDEGEDEGPQPFANRDEAIPVVAVSSPPEESSTPLAARTPSKREPLKETTERLKEKLHDVKHRRKVEDHTTIQDRLFSTLLQQVIPAQDLDSTDDATDKRSRKYIPIERPNFSLPLMSTNFRRFNARIGVAFVFQNRLIRLFSWRFPTQTLSFLAVYTFVCLNPYLLAVVPVVGCLFFLMVPAYLARHPPPPSSANLYHPTYSIHGPPVAPPRTIKPAPELSKDFFRNMRDLQNSMEDFSRLHDSLIALITPYTNFSDEAVSSALFLALAALACFLFIAANQLPWRTIFLTGGWAITLSGHPDAQSFLLSVKGNPEIKEREAEAQSTVSKWVSSDIALDTEPEKREVEIFELQRRDPFASVTSTEWETWLFTPSPYDPMSPPRIAGDRPKGTRFFEDVTPPPGWRWADKKWTLDLLSREWVDERIITGVEVEMEGERWVYDIVKEDGTGTSNRGEWRRRRWARVVERIVKVHQKLTK